MDRYRLWTKPATKTKDTVQKNCRCTSYKSRPHIKIGCTPVRHTWELLKMSCLSLSMQVIEFYLCDGFLRACPFSFAWHSLDRFRFLFWKNRAYRQSFSACRWASCQSASALGLKFWLLVSLGCQMHLDYVTLKTCPQSLSASLRVMSSKKKNQKIRVSPYLSWTLNVCSLTLLRRHCLIGWVTRRVSPCLLVCTLTFNWCWNRCWACTFLRSWCWKWCTRRAWRATGRRLPRDHDSNWFYL